jgi:hypothetical protein
MKQCTFLTKAKTVSMTDEFVDHLAVIEDISTKNSDCHVVIGGNSIIIGCLVN